MKHIHFEAEKDGFYGAYWQNKSKRQFHHPKPTKSSSV